jgi:HEPN domain-containing protein
MQPDARRRTDTLSWFAKAHKDLRCGQIDLAAEPPAPDDALYHCQQAIEKALKGFPLWHDQPFPRADGGAAD